MNLSNRLGRRVGAGSIRPDRRLGKRKIQAFEFVRTHRENHRYQMVKRNKGKQLMYCTEGDTEAGVTGGTLQVGPSFIG